MKMPVWVAAAALAAVVATACTNFRPGVGVTPDVAAAWGCSADSVARAATALDSGLGANRQYIPRVGWTACDLLAHNGAPTRVDYLESGDGRGADWWYQADDGLGDIETHLVALTLDATSGQWIVSYVGW